MLACTSARGANRLSFTVVTALVPALMVILGAAPRPCRSQPTQDDSSTSAAAALQHQVTIDASKSSLLNPMWKRSVGTGHAALWSRADWRAHLAAVRQDCGFEMVRGHGILDNQVMFYDGADANGKSENQSSYFDAFSAFDYMLSIGVRPLVELSFTPDPLNKDWVPGLPVPPACNHFHCESHAPSQPRIVRTHENELTCEPSVPDDGCETFPSNITAYTEYVRDFASALVARYGEDEVASRWLFEVYNEADLHWPFEQYAHTRHNTSGVDTYIVDIHLLTHSVCICTGINTYIIVDIHSLTHSVCIIMYRAGTLSSMRLPLKG